MFLREWKPIFNNPKTSSPSMHFEADLECPVCKNIFSIKTVSYCFFPILLSLQQRIENGIVDIAKKRTCSECGITSSLPDAHRAGLEEEMKSMITAEFIEEETKKVKKRTQ